MLVGGHRQCGAEAAEEHGDIGALRSVVGVELVEHHEPKRVGLIARPQVAVLTPQQQEVEHFVVGEKDVRRVVAECLAAVDEVVGPHRAVRTVLPDVEAGRQAGETFVFRQQAGDSTGLIRRERVHGIEDERLDAGPVRCLLAGAVIQQGHEDAFGLA